MNPVRYP